MSNSVNAIIDIISAFLVVVVFIAGIRQRYHDDGEALRDMLLICVATVLLLDIPAWILDGAIYPGARTVSLSLNTAYYIAQIVYSWLWLRFVDYWQGGLGNRKRRTLVLIALPMIIEIGLIVVNIWTGWIFTIDVHNVYSRGDFYLLNLIPYFFYILSAVVLAVYSVIKAKGTEKRRQNLSILIYMFLPISGALIQSFGYGASLLWPFIALSLLMVYMNLQERHLSDERVLTAVETARSAKLQNELAECRNKIMLSQIQPHFVFNSLSVIRSLCDTDPDSAAQATEDFSEYLRRNMDSIDTDRLIPFEEELRHTERYLSLEKLRFQENLTITYDIRVKNFKLPALTLQPIAENAVRHGITKCENGGTLYLGTEETKDCYIITVRDTGRGFDPSEKKNDGRSHIGISNVRKRLGVMCCGRLVIESAIGVGTAAVITIPKKA